MVLKLKSNVTVALIILFLAKTAFSGPVRCKLNCVENGVGGSEWREENPTCSSRGSSCEPTTLPGCLTLCGEDADQIGNICRGICVVPVKESESQEE